MSSPHEYQDSRFAKHVPVKIPVDVKSRTEQRFFEVGSMFHQGEHKQSVEPKTHTVQINGEQGGIYIAHIAIAMLSAWGGDFDDHDAIFADIYRVDARFTSLARGERSSGREPAGGAWGGHFGNQHAVSARDHRNMGVSAWLGPIAESIEFRLFVEGDNTVSASYFVMQIT